ncbi:MAG: hypothetical protein H7831_08315 [Magnetococcus sp. WYHC-3]
MTAWGRRGWGTGLALFLGLCSAGVAANETAPVAAAPSATAQATAEAREPSGNSLDTLRDPLDLLGELEKKRLALEQRARELDLREAEIKRLEEKLLARLEAMKTLRAQVEANLKREEAMDDENVQRLNRMFSNMKAKAAAEQLAGLDDATAVRVLKVMKERTAAQILNKMDPSRAVALAAALGRPLKELRGGGAMAEEATPTPKP